MNPENIRQLALYFLQDERLTIEDLSESMQMPESRIIEFLYHGKYPDIAVAEEFQTYLNEEYKKRDEHQSYLLGSKLLDSDD